MQRDSDELVTRHAPLVKKVAYHLAGRLPASVQIKDLIQAGMIGLLEASRNYDASHGASFETYAGIRIRGAMLDEIRRSDWSPRSVHRKAREVAAAIHHVERRAGRDASGAEIAKEMGVSLDEYHKVLSEVSGHRVLSFEDAGLDESTVAAQTSGQISDPAQNLDRKHMKKLLADAIGGLPERERLVLALYFDEELNLREIGDVLGITESRVSQIRTQALARLQARLAPHRNVVAGD
jgi:RNA polymerase sigma factor for flagellar operon FliA